MSASGNSRDNRVEFTSTLLDPIDSEGPSVDEDAGTTGTWDTETDHILSYFLGGSESTGSAVPHADFTTSGSNDTNKEDWQHIPPPTPAVQFYSNCPSSQSPNREKARGATSSTTNPTRPLVSSINQTTSNSSLSSMAAALVSGVTPGIAAYNAHQPMNFGTESPISPAALIGLGHENLLLPGPGERPVTATVNTNMGPPEPRPPTGMAAMVMPPTAPTSQVPLTLSQLTPNPHLLYLQQHRTPRSTETKAQRDKRLERNRESARRSRRRRKNKLVSVGAQVNSLHMEIEKVRREHINAMVPELQAHRVAQLLSMPTDNGAKSMLPELLQSTGPSSPIMLSVLDFQYNQLKQLTLPSYVKMLLWFTQRKPSYFVVAKEQNPRMSSKQIGEVLFKSMSTVADEDTDRVNPSAEAHNAAKAWPLFCFEHKLSVDQEERFVHTHRQITARRQPLTWQISAAISTAESLSKVVGSLSHLIAKREERTLLGILSPKQVQKYTKWLEKGNRCHASTPKVLEDAKDISLLDVCKRLNDALQISTSEMVEG